MTSTYRISYRGVVYPAQCDAMGHMTIQFHMAAFDQAMWSLVYSLGWRAVPDRRSRGFADVRHVIDYKAELEIGVPFHIESAPLRIGNSSLLIHHRMHNSIDDSLAAEMEMTSVHFDLIARASVPHEESFRAAVEGIIK